MDVLVKFPTKSRPELFRKTLAAWLADPLPRFLVSINSDDPTMNNPGVKDWLAGQDRVKVRYGDFHSKVEAINDGLADESWSGLLILAADDMAPKRDDYAHRIVELFQKYFPRGDGVLHLNDGLAGEANNTLPILDRKYFDRFGYCYHPSYTSLFADDEFTVVSRALGRAAYVNETIVKHEWIGHTAPDDLHRRNEGYWNQDKVTFMRRRSAGFAQ